MDKIAKRLKAYIDTHPFDPGDSDCATVLDQLYQAYAESHESAPSEISEGFKELEEFLCNLPLEDNNAVCGVDITLVGGQTDLTQLPKGLRAHPYITETIRVCVNDRDRHTGELEVNQIIHHFDMIFGVRDNTKGLFNFGPTKQQRREGAAAVAMAGMFGAAIQAAKDGEVSEETKEKVQEAMNKVEDAATSGLAEYSRRADAAESLIN